MLKKIGFLQALGIAAAVCTAQAGDLKIVPSIAVQEEYTDNVFETNTDRISDFITRAMPGFSLAYKAPAFEGDLSYLFDYRYYAKNSRDDDIAHALAAKGHLTLMENLLFLDISDNYERVSLDVTRNVTRESLFLDQADRNVATASPYLRLRPTSTTEVKLGYRFMDTRYTGNSHASNSQDINNQEVDKMDHIGFLSAEYEFSPRWFATFDSHFIRELSDLDNFNQYQVSAGLRYEYADKSFVFAKAGNTWINYDSNRNLDNFFWHAGVTHTFPTLVATLTTGVKYDEDPLSTIVKETYVRGTVEKGLKNGLLNGSLYYSEFNSEFTRADTDALKTRKYGVEINARHDLTARLSGKLGFIAENYEQQLISGKTRRLLAETGLTYELSEQLTVSLSYIYVDYYSREILTDNSHVNRGILEFRKIF